ncbi:hypothetical protein FQA39_LY18053 [Lamprigera yunnana]|nr:hypothetical protein FQA39_LY18053 [Lamprigera yunnana]
MRTTLTPSFTSSKMKIIFQLLSDCALEFTKHFERQNQNVYNLDMKDAFTRFTNDAIASVAFGLHCNSLEERNNEFYENGKNITSFKGFRFLILILNSICPKFVKIFQVSLFPPKENFFHSVIKETIRKREKEGLIRPDMIHLLLEARNAARPQIEQNSNDAEAESKSQLLNDSPVSYLTDEDITAQALIFFIAGFESSATLMSFLSYELALHPEIQKRLRIEIDETSRNCNGKLTYEALHKMNYMDMVVSETLRKWPPLYQIDRVCTKDYIIEPVNNTEKSLLIKTGAQIMVPVVGIHRDPKYFPSPEKFDPERFSRENKDKIEPYSYLPFGLGPRICIASRFATMECKTLMFYLLSKFEIVPIEKTSIPIVLQEGAFNVNSKTGIWLGLKLRYSK